MKKLLAALAITLGLSAPASATVAINGPLNFYLAPPTYNGTLYDELGTNANWNIAQWGIYGGSLGAWVNTGGTEYYTTNANGAISDFWNGNWADLGSYGWISSAQHIPCQANNAPLEMDNFQQPNDSSYSSYTQGVINTPVIGSINHLYHTLNWVALTDAVHDTNCTISGWATQAFAQSSFILHNTVNGSTLFIQLDLYDNHINPRNLWWATGAGNQWGYTLAVTSIIGGTFPNTLNKVYSINNDILPAIKSIITDGATNHGLDGTYADWELTSAYSGVAIWGHINFEVEFEDFGLTYD